MVVEEVQPSLAEAVALMPPRLKSPSPRSPSRCPELLRRNLGVSTRHVSYEHKEITTRYTDNSNLLNNYCSVLLNFDVGGNFHSFTK